MTLPGALLTFRAWPCWPVATMRLRLLDLVEKRAFYVAGPSADDTGLLAGKPVYELVSPKVQVYVMQLYSRKSWTEVLPTPIGAALGSRLKPPKGWQYRSRTLTAIWSRRRGERCIYPG